MIKFEYDEIFPEDLNLEDLNEFVKMVLNKCLEGEPIEDNLECWGEYIGELIHDKYPDELSSDQSDEYKKFVSKYGSDFELGVTVVNYLDRRSIECDINRHDVPMLLEYLNTPYENEKQAYEKFDKYFDNKSFFDYSTNFFYKIFKYYMSCSCVIIFRERKEYYYKFAYVEKFFDFLFDTKIIKRGIPYGTVYEIFKNEEMVGIVTTFVNEQLEVESKVQSQDNELRELLEYFVEVKLYHMEKSKELIHFCHYSKVYENINRSKKKLDKVGQGKLYTINKNEEVIGSLESVTFYNLK